MTTRVFGLLSTALLVTAFAGCGGNADEDDGGDDNNPPVVCPVSTADHRYIAFAGYCWEVRKTTEPQAAGPNYFSNDSRDVWVDADGRLHMKISSRDGKWLCSEIFSQGQFGYGTYSFQVVGNVAQLDRNVVLGFFTWDDNYLDIGAFSEIDIELTKWGDPVSMNLYYSVQPIYGPDTVSGMYPERSASRLFWLDVPISTHSFTWSPDSIIFYSHEGFDDPDGRPLGTWEFTSANPPRRYNTTTLATPVVIPAPGATTSIRINLWLNDKDKSGLGDPPANGQEVEVVIDDFEYTPL
jgi:hypothetical protein